MNKVKPAHKVQERKDTVERLSEVCNKLEVSRRVLQEYDRLDIVKHSSETKGGYWLYSEEDVSKLALALIFFEAGYSRREIREIIKNEAECKTLYGKINVKLERKKNRIEWLKTVAHL